MEGKRKKNEAFSSGRDGVRWKRDFGRGARMEAVFQKEVRTGDRSLFPSLLTFLATDQFPAAGVRGERGINR